MLSSSLLDLLDQMHLISLEDNSTSGTNDQAMFVKFAGDVEFLFEDARMFLSTPCGRLSCTCAGWIPRSNHFLRDFAFICLNNQIGALAKHWKVSHKVHNHLIHALHGNPPPPPPRPERSNCRFVVVVDRANNTRTEGIANEETLALLTARKADLVSRNIFLEFHQLTASHIGVGALDFSPPPVTEGVPSGGGTGDLSPSPAEAGVSSRKRSRDVDDNVSISESESVYSVHGTTSPITPAAPSGADFVAPRADDGTQPSVHGTTSPFTPAAPSGADFVAPRADDETQPEVAPSSPSSPSPPVAPVSPPPHS